MRPRLSHSRRRLNRLAARAGVFRRQVRYDTPTVCTRSQRLEAVATTTFAVFRDNATTLALAASFV
jgi:predicted RNA polymerase sigma factor